MPTGHLACEHATFLFLIIDRFGRRTSRAQMTRNLCYSSVVCLQIQEMAKTAAGGSITVGEILTAAM